MIEPTRTLAVAASGGYTNQLFQVATLVRAATALEVRVLVLFREAAVKKLRRDRVNVPEWSPSYARVEGSLEERLRSAGFTDLETFLREAKEHGDFVSFWVSAETIEQEGIDVSELSEIVDGTKPDTDFAVDARRADTWLTF
jgi:peroxiredoxin family protein